MLMCFGFLITTSNPSSSYEISKSFARVTIHIISDAAQISCTQRKIERNPSKKCEYRIARTKTFCHKNVDEYGKRGYI
jgi:hypothetical protein